MRTMVEIEVGDQIVESLQSDTVPQAGSLISVGSPPDRYNVKVMHQHWVIDTPVQNPRHFRCILVCEKIVPKTESPAPNKPDPKTKFTSVSGKTLNRACPLCSVSNPIVQVKCQKPECPIR